MVLLGLLTSQAARLLADTLTFGITLAIMTNIVQYAHGITVTSRKQVEPTLRKWGPFSIILFSCVGNMVQITKEVLVDSSSAALRKSDGSNARFNFDSCSYTASASPLPGVASATCAAEPHAIVQASALSAADNALLNSAAMDNACYYCSWGAMFLTIVGFMWLSDMLPWIQSKWRTMRQAGLAQALLETDSCTDGCRQKLDA